VAALGCNLQACQSYPAHQDVVMTSPMTSYCRNQLYILLSSF